MSFTLTNYWWLLIWIFVGGGVINFVFRKKEIVVLGEKKTRWSIPAALLLAAPYFLWSGWRSDDFGDTGVYRRMFSDMPSVVSEMSAYLDENTKSRVFSALSICFKSVFGDSDILYFLIIAIVQILCLVLIYRKYSSNYWISIFLFVASTDYMSWMHNGMRQFIAVAGIFACFGLIVKRKLIPVIVVILLMATIHASALIMLPIIFVIQGKAWNKLTILFMVFIGVIIAFVDRFTSILDNLLEDTQYSDLVTSEVWTNDTGTNILRILVYSVPAILSLIGKKYVDEANDPVINVSVNASICTMMLYALAGVSSGIYIGRLPVYTSLMSYISLPWLIKNIFSKNTARVIWVIMIVGYVIFFYYQMHFTWDAL